MKLPKILIIFAVVGLFLSKDLLIRSFLENSVRLAGLQLNIKHFHFDLVQSQIWAKDIRLSSPKGFKEEPMLALDFLFINLNPWAALTAKVHFYDLVIHLNELRFVRNQEGEMNLNLVKLPAAPVKIDHFEIKLDRVVYKDFSIPVSSVERSFDVSVHEKEVDVSDLKSINGILNVVVLKAVRNASFARLFNLSPQDFLKDNALAILTSKRFVGGAASAVADIVTKPFDGPEEGPREEMGNTKIDEAQNEVVEKEKLIKEAKEAAKDVREEVEEFGKSLEDIGEETSETVAVLKEVIEEHLELQKEGIREAEKEVQDEKKAVKEATEEIKKQEKEIEKTKQLIEDSRL